MGSLHHNRLLRRRTMATIDMTPLMDLTFMLLIIFVITVPSIYYKSDVKLTPPDATTGAKLAPEIHSLFVELDQNGAIWLGHEQQSRSLPVSDCQELTRLLQEEREKFPAGTDPVVYLVGDRARQYAEVVDIANAIQQAGLNQVSLVFQPEKK